MRKRVSRPGGKKVAGIINYLAIDQTDRNAMPVAQGVSLVAGPRPFVAKREGSGFLPVFQIHLRIFAVVGATGARISFSRRRGAVWFMRDA